MTGERLTSTIETLKDKLRHLLYTQGLVVENGPRLISLQPTADDSTDAVHGMQNIKKSLESVHCNVRNGTPKVSCYISACTKSSSLVINWHPE